MRTTPEQRAELMRLHEAASPEPWTWKGDKHDYGYVDRNGRPTVLFGEYCEGAVPEDDADGRCAAHARNALHDLLADLTDAEARIRELEAGLKKYGRHVMQCDLLGWRGPPPPGTECTCGLAELMGRAK